ncbi:MAG: hypothetical protein IT488_14200 [Gammaproteobacteria bacterium]|nr:hypothetical protein [Gammaproteobacteria bacterium]
MWFIVQRFKSEREKISVVPDQYWHFSPEDRITLRRKRSRPSICLAQVC